MKSNSKLIAFIKRWLVHLSLFLILLIGIGFIYHLGQTNALSSFTPVADAWNQTCSPSQSQYPQCGGTCNGVTYDSSHTVMVTKMTDNSCNVSYSCSDLGQKAGQCGNPAPTPTPTATPACSASQTQYPQCGGTCNGTTYDSSHTVMVTKTTDSSCQVSYSCKDMQQIAGQCGNPSPTPTPSACPTQTRVYGQCGGTAGLENIPSDHNVQVTETMDCHGNPISYQNVDQGQQPGLCGFSPTVTTCKGSMTETDLENQLHGANYPGPYGPSNLSNEIAAFNNAACPPATPSPTLTPVSPVVQVPQSTTQNSQQVVSQSCPAGSTMTMQGNTIVCIVQTQTAQQSQTNSQVVNNYLAASTTSTSTNPTTTTAVTVVTPTPTPSPTPTTTTTIVYTTPQTTTTTTGTTPVVTYTNPTSTTYVSQLPKTGPPLGALALSGLVPYGLYIRRTGKFMGKMRAFDLFKDRESKLSQS